MFYGQTSPNLAFLLKIMNTMSSGLKRMETFQRVNINLKSDMTCGQVWLPILSICALHLSHPKCTQTAVNTHTHTPAAVGRHLCCGTWVAVEWFGALLKGTSFVVLKVEESAVLSLPPPTIPAGPETRTRNLWVMSPTL